ncbi:YopX family protein [Lysinibacillus sp. CTST325]
MREINFRIRVKSTNELSNIARIDFISKEVFALKQLDGYLEEFIYTFDEVDFIESTGLKDENGKEIHEGDIVQSIYDETYVSVVEYCTENIGSCGCCYDEFEGVGFKAKDLKLKECIVIGNIYENPELLGDSQ